MENTFGWALKMMQGGHAVAREGWNGPGQYLRLQGSRRKQQDDASVRLHQDGARREGAVARVPVGHAWDGLGERMRWAVLLAVVLCGCDFGSILKPEPPQCSSIDPTTMATDWNGYHLRSGNRHPKLVDKTGGLYDVQAMADSWAALGAPVDFAGTSDLVVEVRIGEPEGALGVAEVKILSGHIVYGRITMNPKAIARAGLADVAGAHVLCQEGGHSPFGLGHERSMLDTCQNDCADTATRAEWVACLNHPEGTTPNAADGELLKRKYAHDDDLGEEPPDLNCQGWVEVHRFADYGAGHAH